MWWILFTGYVIGRLDQKHGYKAGLWLGEKIRAMRI
jgi:hypothetical protein